MKDNIHIRIDKDIADAARIYAARNGISLAAAISVLIRRALEGKQS